MGEPRCRTVVFRGFLDLPDNHAQYCVAADNIQQSCVLQMFTDARSAKVVNQANTTEVVWWFPRTNEQFRIRGKLSFVGEGKSMNINNDNTSTDVEDEEVLRKARIQLWQKLSKSARDSFFIPKIPGYEYQEENEEENNEVGGHESENNEDIIPDPPQCFLLMLVIPHTVDYL